MEADKNNVFSTRSAIQQDKIHHYPLFLSSSADNQNSHSLEQARECIQFTAVRQPGVSFNKEFTEKVRTRAIEDLTPRQISAAKSANFLDNIQGKTTTNKILQEEVAKRSRIAAQAGSRTGAEAIDKTFDVLAAVAGGTVSSALGAAREATRQPEIALEDCFLYMPASVVFNEGAMWQKEELGFSGNAVSNLIKGQKSIGNILSDFGAGAAIPVAKAAAVGLSTFVAGKIGGVLTVLGAGGLDKAALRTTRLSQNPYEEQLFAGVDFRTFSFNFQFVAVSREEYEAVKSIIHMFRSHSRPTFALSGNGEQALYSYPNEFAIKFLHLEAESGFQFSDGSFSPNQFVENPAIPKLHNCVLTNITTDYSPDGWVAHDRGEPNAINMQLQFTETKKNTRRDIDEGNY